MKFCIHCRYYSRPIMPNDIGWGWTTMEICKHEKSKYYDLVTGNLKYKPCKEMRFIGSLCKKQGILFYPKGE